jgi:hypothetical protein
VKKAVIRMVIAKKKITIMGIGSSSSFTKGAPIVMDLLIRNMILIAVALLLKGKILSSSKALWKMATKPT